MSMLLEVSARSSRRARKSPPLENGDRLTSAEFLRRYEAMPEIKKAELIEGHVHIPPPLRADAHSEPDGLLHGWLFYYSTCTTGVKFYPNPTLILGDAKLFPKDKRILPCRHGWSAFDREKVSHPPTHRNP